MTDEDLIKRMRSEANDELKVIHKIVDRLDDPIANEILDLSIGFDATIQYLMLLALTKKKKKT